MSHCTTFEFQYTNRKLIIKSFEQLDLNWKNDIVCSYASAYDKERGIIQSKRPAIVAESNGFNYFMCNEGNYYELSVEKHNMNWKEEAYARKTNGDANADLSMQDFETVIKRMIPMAKMRQEDFKDLRDWANENAVSASVSSATTSNSNDSLGGRRIDLI